MNERQSKLLVAIIDQFIHTAVPIGSRKVLEAGVFDCSSATIRSEMYQLEDEGFLEQPHVSAGRIPTVKGYRTYVQELMEPSRHEKEVRRKFASLREQYERQKERERVYEAVALLSHMVKDIAFASVPHKERVYYMGLANVLKQPEFQINPLLATGVAEVLEEHLHDVLEHLDIDENIRYYIGEEHILPQFQSCGLLVRSYKTRGEKCLVGILGPLRMDYGYNTVALDLVTDLLRQGL